MKVHLRQTPTLRHWLRRRKNWRENNKEIGRDRDLQKKTVHPTEMMEFRLRRQDIHLPHRRLLITMRGRSARPRLECSLKWDINILTRTATRVHLALASLPSLTHRFKPALPTMQPTAVTRAMQLTLPTGLLRLLLLPLLQLTGNRFVSAQYSQRSR